jgi:hypothetical protein
LGLPQPPRDRAAEFKTVADAEFAAWTEQAIMSIFALLDGASFDANSSGIPAWNDAGIPKTATYSLGHALSHLGEHVGHLHMTRELLRPES